jgi:hypothetical protein
LKAGEQVLNLPWWAYDSAMTSPWGLTKDYDYQGLKKIKNKQLFQMIKINHKQNL